MSTTSYKTVEGILFVEMEEPTDKHKKAYYTNSGELKSSSGKDAPRHFKKAVIKNTFDETKYPVGSNWMMGESPGMKINFFGEKFIAIQEKDLYARID